jgi:hypothetical protein
MQEVGSSGKRVWIACGDSSLERRAFNSLCELLGDEGVLIEHAARTLRRHADRIRLVEQLQLHRDLGRSVLFVRRLDRLSAATQARLCHWLASGRSGADCVVATGKLPRGSEEGYGLQKRVETVFRPHLEVGFDAMANEPSLA